MTTWRRHVSLTKETPITDPHTLIHYNDYGRYTPLVCLGYLLPLRFRAQNISDGLMLRQAA